MLNEGLSASSAVTTASLSSFDEVGAPSAFRNALSEFVYTRTYARWMPEEGRRETWAESVDRYLAFLQQERSLPEGLVPDLRRAMLRMEVLPSMRALWSAGEAARRDNTMFYNCSFVPLDNLKAFAELLYILMMGCGVGFSVERQFVSNLPVVGAPQGKRIYYMVEDSTEGWANAFYEGLVYWFKGIVVKYDFSQVREAGAPLKVKGGRASGPDPLKRLLDFAQRTVLGASGRQLTSLECHDIACMVGEIVMAGGVRRAALISFSDPDDDTMRHAKDWSRGEFPACRYMANNSAFWYEKPERPVFNREWTALKESGSGERGFFMFPPHKRAARKSDARGNPCVTAATWVNTVDGPRQVSELVGKSFVAVVDGTAYPSTEGGFWSTGVKPVLRLQTIEGYSLDLTGNHKVCRVVQTERVQRFEWVPADELKAGDLVRLNNHRPVSVSNEREFNRGWLLGSLIGDGTFSRVEGKSDLGCLTYWGEDGEYMANLALSRIDAVGLPHRSDLSVVHNKANDTWGVRCASLADFAKNYGIVPANKALTPDMERELEPFVAGVLSGLFDADGCVLGTQDKGVSVRLSQSNLDTLYTAQRMLLRLGIASTVYENRREAGSRMMPDGKGGTSEYWCQAQHELVVSRDNLFRFAEVVGFSDPQKSAHLSALLGAYSRTPNRERFVARVKSLVPVGEQEVFDCTIPELAAFDANGLYVHNCGEILLRYMKATDPWTGAGGGGQFCNLSAAVMRAEDTKETMARKVRLAAWVGAIQSTFTNFPYLRPGWAQTCDEDRLLGVDITGQCDNPALSNDPEAMSFFNAVARETAKQAAAHLGINEPAAITCGKPSGNSSQLVDCASGFHPRYAPYYIRRVRIANTDPLFRLAREAGVPAHKDNSFADWDDDKCPTWVMEFPVMAPKGAMTRNDETAIQQLNRYLHIMRTWCSEKGHNQSATIYVRDHEWDGVGEWVYANFDEITGLSFLPYDGGTYKLAPYEEITEAQYHDLMKNFPALDYSMLALYEREDMGNGAQEYACVGGSCEVDFSKFVQAPEDNADAGAK